MKEEVHSEPCKQCPSHWHIPDPEAEDLLNACLKGEISEQDYLFECAWRRGKTCFGLFDRYKQTLAKKR